ncbi:peptidylprolyl isomerase [Actinoplanes octamycinicus]|uniref:peptidylprolyl isomerase n=1 Tax=Actinoplanes octamycinicus TaxID=135948 RepID=UPI001619C1A4
MSSIKDRQRAAARARLEKEMAERAAAAKSRRRKQAIIGSALAVVVVAGAAVWLVTALKKDDKKSTASAAGTVACSWTPEDSTTGGPGIKDTGGTPPTTVPNVGKETLTLDTGLGVITAAVDKAKAPCTVAAFDYLAAKKFWDGTKCHRLTTAGIKVLQCGDPTAKGKGYRETDGQGGPNFKYAEENLPLGKDPTYPKATLAMARTQTPGTTGSQFFIVWGDDIKADSLPAEYTILGTITKGMDIVEKVGKAGSVTKGMDIVEKVGKAGSDNANNQGDGTPQARGHIKTLTMAAA